MKRILIYISALLLGSPMLSCDSDKLDPVSIFVDDQREKTDFDRYLEREFAISYNIDVKYRMEDIELDHQYHVIPAKVESSKVMAVLLKHLWLDVYGEVSPDGVDFMRQFAVRIVHFLGSGQYGGDGTVVLGTAEGGKKITLNNLNRLDPKDAESINVDELLKDKGEFQVIHHEFAHILHQTKNYSETFQLISGGYIGDQWVNQGHEKAHSLGFVTPYAMSVVDEDFVETLSIYIVLSPEKWEAFLADGTPAGRALIDRKVAMVREYLKFSWGIDMDQLRDIIIRRAGEVGGYNADGEYKLYLDFENLK